VGSASFWNNLWRKKQGKTSDSDVEERIARDLLRHRKHIITFIAKSAPDRFLSAAFETKCLWRDYKEAQEEKGHILRLAWQVYKEMSNLCVCMIPTAHYLISSSSHRLHIGDPDVTLPCNPDG